MVHADRFRAHGPRQGCLLELGSRPDSLRLRTEASGCNPSGGLQGSLAGFNSYREIRLTETLST